MTQGTQAMKCEYCGLEAKRLHTHRRCCPDNPVVWSATRDALDDGAGYIVTASFFLLSSQSSTSTWPKQRDLPLVCSTLRT